MYKVIQPFNLFHYNAKRRNHKLVHYDIGDMVNESIKRRLRKPDFYLSYENPTTR